MSAKNEDKNDEKTGLPLMSETERNAGSALGTKILFGLAVIPPLIGTGIASAIRYFGNTASYDAKMATVASHDLHFAAVGALILAGTTGFLNTYPMIWKSRVMKQTSGNLRVNMYVYKTIGAGATEGSVVLASEGDAGSYNRANRSLHHFTENVPALLVTLPLAAYCFPGPALGAVGLFCVGRVLHQTRYANDGYCAHGTGFMLSQLSAAACQGMLVLTALKGFGVL
jgi:hypothetical protein